jgi:hypothetical protein
VSRSRARHCAPFAWRGIILDGRDLQQVYSLCVAIHPVSARLFRILVRCCSDRDSALFDSRSSKICSWLAQRRECMID